MGQKIGIMGGSFNPIHNMHLLMGEMAYDEFCLDKVLIMPLKKPYFDNKKLSAGIQDEDRVQMILRAISSNPHLEFSDMELRREGVTYTVDTLEALHEAHPENEYFFICGADSLFGMERWYRAERIFELATIIAAARDDASSKAAEEKSKAARTDASSMETDESALDHIDVQIDYLKEHFQARVFRLNSPNIDISSSYVRNRVGSGKSCRYLVPDSVYEYIKERGLYE